MPSKPSPEQKQRRKEARQKLKEEKEQAMMKAIAEDDIGTQLELETQQFSRNLREKNVRHNREANESRAQRDARLAKENEHRRNVRKDESPGRKQARREGRNATGKKLRDSRKEEKALRDAKATEDYLRQHGYRDLENQNCGGGTAGVAPEAQMYPAPTAGSSYFSGGYNNPPQQPQGPCETAPTNPYQPSNQSGPFQGGPYQGGPYPPPNQNPYGYGRGGNASNYAPYRQQPQYYPQGRGSNYQNYYNP